MSATISAVAGRLAFAGRRLLTIVRCAACGEPSDLPGLFCDPCAVSIIRCEPERLPSGLALAAYGFYGGALADAVTALKYRARPELGAALGRLLCELVLEADVVVPVPLHPRRLAERGYNQSALVARPLARHLKARFAPTLLRRTGYAPPQASLDRQARQAITTAFAIRHRGALRGRRVIVVDDVATTGATLTGCAAPLLAAGAAVTAVALARQERLILRRRSVA